MQELLKIYGPVHIAVNGKEALDAVRIALLANEPYDLICLDIMMPEMDGQQALSGIRALEEAQGIFSSDGPKIMMTTVMADLKNVSTGYMNLCDACLTKHVHISVLDKELRTLKLIS
jgi:two-component system, chemotaxis family, chemotaxis protein CheY